MKQEILNHYKGHEELIERLHDLSEMAYTGKVCMTAFLTESEINVAKSFLGNSIDYSFDGGYPGAVRARLIFDLYQINETSPVVCLVAKFNSKFNKIAHKDLLGALMNLQIERSQLGDIWIEEDKVVVYCTGNIADYIMMNCTSIKHASIQFQISDIHYVHVNQYEYFTKIISSYRLDCIVSSLANCSRSKAQEKIKAQLVSVNDEILAESSYLCNNGDTVSIRRSGRFRIEEQLSTTKKENIVVRFAKYS